jgi:heme oxygenase (mycobilin-producing)
MSVVRINVIDVPEGMGEVLEERFAKRAGAVDSVEGFEGFELLRPTDDNGRYFVYTRWASEEAFQAWRASEAFGTGHAQHHEHGPVGTGSELLEFDVVIRT